MIPKQHSHSNRLEIAWNHSFIHLVIHLCNRSSSFYLDYDDDDDNDADDGDDQENVAPTIYMAKVLSRL